MCEIRSTMPETRLTDFACRSVTFLIAETRQTMCVAPRIFGGGTGGSNSGVTRRGTGVGTSGDT